MALTLEDIAAELGVTKEQAKAQVTAAGIGLEAITVERPTLDADGNPIEKDGEVVMQKIETEYVRKRQEYNAWRVGR